MGVQAFLPPSVQAEQEETLKVDGIKRPLKAMDAGALCFFASAVFLLLALASLEVDLNDPSLQGANWMGEVGAAIAGLFARGFGLGAWLTPCFLLSFGLPMLRGKKPDLVGFRLAGDLLILLLCAALIQVSAPNSQVFNSLPAGGNVGLFFGELMRGLFSAPGSYLVGVTCIALILIGRASFSFIEFCERLVAIYRSSMLKLVVFSRYLSDIWQRACELRQAEPEALHDVQAAEEVLLDIKADAIWVPNEETGIPPLAVSNTLRRSFEAHFSDEEAEPSLSEPLESAPVPSAAVALEETPQRKRVTIVATPATTPKAKSLVAEPKPRTEVSKALLKAESQPAVITPSHESRESVLLTPTEDGLMSALFADASEENRLETEDAIFTEHRVTNDSADCIPDALAQPAQYSPALESVSLKKEEASTLVEQPGSVVLEDFPSANFSDEELEAEAPDEELEAEAPVAIAALKATQDEDSPKEFEPYIPRQPSMASREVTLTPEEKELLDPTRLHKKGPEIKATPLLEKRAVVRGRAPAKKRAAFILPDTSLLEAAGDEDNHVDQDVLMRNAELLEKTLADYGVSGTVEEIHPGPTVTTYELAPAPGTKVSKVAGLSDDLALGLSRKVRIIAPIPGKSRIGFELPNDQRVPVNLRELVEDEGFVKLSEKAALPVVLGRDIVGAPLYGDLSSMPHIIVAGATGAGKSVGLNVMLSSLLFKRTPEDLRLLMVDPKVVELAPFDRIPHLLLPVVTDMKQAAQALKWAVDEMERRYQLFAEAGTKNIETYNRFVKRVAAGEVEPPKVQQVEAVNEDGDLVMVKASAQGTDGAELPEKLPYIVIVVDEFADLMMQQGKEVESSVARLAQKARAAGMHVILATQRPSVDVITGMIKANFPSRIAFRVAQKVDSRTILDEQGAEVLLGRGDLLVKLNGATDTRRVQCPFVSEEEVSALTDHLRAQGEPDYQDSILVEDEESEEIDLEEKIDARFEEAVMIVRDSARCSTSWLQRKMTVGYNRAAKMVDMMESRGYVGPANGSKDREVFLPSA